MTKVHTTRFSIGQMVRHRDDAFRGVVIDIDASYAGLPGETGEVAPDQPFYQVLAIGPDGALYLLSDSADGRVLRVRPK